MPQHPGHPGCHANGDEGRIVGTEQAGATRPREKHRWGGPGEGRRWDEVTANPGALPPHPDKRGPHSE